MTKEPLVEELQYLTIITIDGICFILDKSLNFLNTIPLDGEKFNEKIISKQLDDGRPVLVTKWTQTFIYVFLFHYKMKFIFNINGKYIDYINNVNCIKAIEELGNDIDGQNDENDDDFLSKIM